MPDPKSHAGKASAAIFFVILIAASAASFTIVVSPYVFVFHDPGALRVGASLNSSSVVLNQTVMVTLWEKNTLRFPMELPQSGGLRALNLSSSPCGGLYPMGLAVFRGYYSPQNVSSAEPFDVFDAFGVFGCPAEGISNTFTFQPLQNVTRVADLRGYWSAGETRHPGGGTSPGVLHPFPAGSYTLLVGDDWGHTALLHFDVGGIALSLKDVVLCPSDCGYPIPNLSGTVYFMAPSPLRSLQVFINGTDEGVRTFNSSLGPVDLHAEYEAGFQYPPIVYRDTYVVRFVLVFDDNSTATTTKTLVAG